MHADTGLAVAYDPAPTYDRITRFKRRFRGRLISLIVTAAILGGITAWQWERTPLRLLVVGNSIILGVSLIALGVTWWLARRARAAVATLAEGTAVLLDRGGLELLGHRIAWEDLTGLDCARGRVPFGPRLRVRDRSGRELTVPWDQLDTRPAGLDSAVRAYSRGRFGIDFSAFDA